MNRQYLDPALLGSYPEELHEVFGEAWPDWPAADLELIKQPLDYIGVNYYTRAVVRIRSHRVAAARPATVKQKQHTHTETGWEVYPQGLIDTLLWIKDNYGNPPVYITENGAVFLRSAAGRRTGVGRSAARRLPAQAHHCRARRDPTRRGHSRLFRLVAVR